ncbi:hypothetical protein ALC56_11226 [Trachymyrmex septentrionalis]|uniref:Uncharacterized protein n=1 Tax=Trachymyrmex septentrionalis TaxID=34720 RepID=A0A195F3I0_9HYME|nr:hypothetical protein ALC56_11226 [Trachymyrmex septentrionalis]
MDTSPTLSIGGSRARAALLTTSGTGTGSTDRRVVFLASQPSVSSSHETKTWPHHWSPHTAKPGRHENESARFDSDAFNALTVIARVGGPDGDTGSLWHCESPFGGRHATHLLPAPLSFHSLRLSLFVRTTHRAERATRRTFGILNSARHPHVFGCVRVHARSIYAGCMAGLYGPGPGADVQGPGGRQTIFRRSSVHADSTVINLTAMDTSLRDYHFDSPPYAGGIYIM